MPIALAVVASAMKRYPLHGRLILELVPAFFLLIAEGTEMLRGREKGRIKLGYILALILLFTYPCGVALENAASMPFREFNRHGDLRKNIFITNPTAPARGRRPPQRVTRGNPRSRFGLLWLRGGPRWRSARSVEIAVNRTTASARLPPIARAVQNVGMTIFSPPFIADSWAHSPTMVQFADVAASGMAGRSPLTADKKACTR